MSSDGVRCVAFKPDSPNILVSGSCDKTIKMWDIASGSIRSTLTWHTSEKVSAVTGVAFSADGQWLIAGFYDGMIRRLDVQDAHARGGTVVSAV